MLMATRSSQDLACCFRAIGSARSWFVPEFGKGAMLGGLRWRWRLDKAAKTHVHKRGVRAPKVTDRRWSQVRNSSVPLRLIWRDKKIDVRSGDFGAVEKRLSDMTDAELAALEQRMIAAAPIVLEATAEVSDDAGELADGDVEDSPPDALA